MKATLHCAVTGSLFLSVLVLFPLTAVATEVGPGPVYGHWYASGNPYNVNGEIYVPSDSTLNIHEGVAVIFQGHYKFRVNSAATLIAVGAPHSSIVFTPADSSTGWHGIRFYSATDACSLCYCRIEYGKATGSGEDAQGGAIYCSNSSPTISDNSISNNSAGEGGGIFCNESSPTIRNNTICGNSAFGQTNSPGGGVYCGGNSNPTISGNTISGNTASGNPYGPGGGVFCSYSNPAISGNTINSDTSSSDGGGIFCDNSSPSISNNSICNNAAAAGSGGIHCQSESNPTIIDNTISGNSAGSGGGIGCLSGSNATITANLISDNSVQNYGGGIDCHEASPTISDNTFFGNTAGIDGGAMTTRNCEPTISDNTIDSDSALSNGGGIACSGSGTPLISGNVITRNSASGGGGISCTITGAVITSNTVTLNTASYGGGAIFCDRNAVPIVSNTILWEDWAPNGPEIYVEEGSAITVTYSDVQDTLWPGQGNISEDPLFCGPEQGDYALHCNSPCVGTGQNGENMGALGVGCCDIMLTIVPGDTAVAHNDTLCYHVICENGTPDYQSLSFKVNVRLPNGNMYGPIFGPARFGMFGNGISEGDMCHRVPPQAPVGDYWLFAEVYNTEYSAKDSMAFTVTGDGALPGIDPWPGQWQTVVARLGDKDFIGDGVTSSPPAEFALGGNYPNPFNASTVIAYQLPASTHVTLEVFNLLGRRVATLVDERQEAGYRSVVWDPSEVSSGLYFYKLTAGEFTETRRMMLVK